MTMYFPGTIEHTSPHRAEPIVEKPVGPPPKGPGLVALVAPRVGVVGACVTFLWLALLAHSVPYFPIDVEITRALQGVTTPLLLVPFRALNAFGFAPIVTIVFALVVLALFLARYRWEAICAGLVTLVAAGLTDLVKAIVGRPRPFPDLVHVAHEISSPGFPAGHVMNFTPFVGFLCYLASVRMAPSWKRTTLIGALLIMIVMMGAARIYDGEHWPSDVLGSYLLGSVWLVAAISLYEWGRRRSTHPTRTARLKP
jgi:undecaprenyl-diphosphatase